MSNADWDDFTATDPTGANNLNTAAVLHSAQHTRLNAAVRAAKGLLVRKGTTGGDRLRGGVVFTFDDGTVDHYSTVFPLFQAAGKKAVFYVCTGTGPVAINQPGYVTTAQLLEMQAAGHEVGAHGVNHNGIAGKTTLAEFEAVAVQNKTDLQALGFNVRHYCASGGQSDKFARDVILDYFDTLRLTNNGPGTQELTTANAIRQAGDIDDNESVLIDILNDALAQDRIVVFTGHVVDAARSTKINNLIAHANTIGLPVLTMSQAYDQIVQTRLSRRGGILGRDGSAGFTRLAALAGYFSTLRASAFDFIDPSHGRMLLRLQKNADGQPEFAASGADGIDFNTAGVIGLRTVRGLADRDTYLLVRVNRGGALSLDRVTVGAPDSAGTGFRTLRVVN